MASLTSRDRALLRDLVPLAQQLAQNYAATLFLAWLRRLNSHECAVLMLWIAQHGDTWLTAKLDSSRPEECARAISA